jgi:hypothetical protein
MSQTFSAEAVDKGTRLVMFALNPRLRPSANRDYHELIREYLASSEVREAAQVVSHAMGIELRDDPVFFESFGPIAIVSPGGSPFAPKLVDFRGAMGVGERIGYGLLFFIVAAYAYPSAEALAEDVLSLGHKITRTDLSRFATETCEALQRTLETDPHRDEKTMRGCEHLLGIRARGKDGDQKNLGYMIGFLLEKYADFGLFTKEQNATEEPVYFARPHYRLQVRYMVREAMPAMTYLLELARQKRGAEVNHG